MLMDGQRHAIIRQFFQNIFSKRKFKNQNGICYNFAKHFKGWHLICMLGNYFSIDSLKYICWIIISANDV